MTLILVSVLSETGRICSLDHLYYPFDKLQLCLHHRSADYPQINSVGNSLLAKCVFNSEN